MNKVHWRETSATVVTDWSKITIFRKALLYTSPRNRQSLSLILNNRNNSTIPCSKRRWSSKTSGSLDQRIKRPDFNKERRNDHHIPRTLAVYFVKPVSIILICKKREAETSKKSVHQLKKSGNLAEWQTNQCNTETCLFEEAEGGKSKVAKVLTIHVVKYERKSALL